MAEFQNLFSTVVNLHIPKITAPSTILVDFYIYYSDVTLILSWILTPLLFYIIFTQSKNLKTFKWLILNHSFWCLSTESLFALIKPLFLSPAAGGFALGIIRYWGDYRTSGIATTIGFCLIANCVFALSATLASRYLLIFPSKLTKWFTLKAAFIFALGGPFIAYSIVFITFYPYLSNCDSNGFYEIAKNYDPILENYFSEPTFFYMPHKYHDIGDVICLGTFIILYIASIALIIFLLYQTSKHKSAVANKMSKSLLTSSIIQIVITGIFLFLPITFYFAIIRFDIPYSANFMCIMICLIDSHCLIEFIATLYFIAPYRSFIIKFYRKKVLKQSPMMKIRVSSASRILPSNIEERNI